MKVALERTGDELEQRSLYRPHIFSVYVADAHSHMKSAKLIIRMRNLAYVAGMLLGLYPRRRQVVGRTVARVDGLPWLIYRRLSDRDSSRSAGPRQN